MKGTRSRARRHPPKRRSFSVESTMDANIQTSDQVWVEEKPSNHEQKEPRKKNHGVAVRVRIDTLDRLQLGMTKRV